MEDAERVCPQSDVYDIPDFATLMLNPWINCRWGPPENFSSASPSVSSTVSNTMLIVYTISVDFIVLFLFSPMRSCFLLSQMSRIVPTDSFSQLLKYYMGRTQCARLAYVLMFKMAAMRPNRMPEKHFRSNHIFFCISDPLKQAPLF
jgi:uncharacterized membrane protein